MQKKAMLIRKSDAPHVAPIPHAAYAWTLIVTLVMVSLLISAPATAAAPGSWTVVGDEMSAGHRDATVNLLLDGRVLIAGGSNASTSATSTADIYDPSSDTFSSATMTTPRIWHTATTLDDGRVLVVGGAALGLPTASNTVEIFDPTNDSFTRVANLLVKREVHSATLLDDGRVLVMGGHNASITHASSEIYDPATDSWTAAANMTAARYLHTSVLLNDGTVLVTGGQGTSVGESAEIYHPSTDSWEAVGDMAFARSEPRATLLFDGSVLVTGRNNSYGSIIPRSFYSAEVYHPDTKTWERVGDMERPRALHTSTRLANGKVLVAGSAVSNFRILNNSKHAEIYDPVTKSWTTTGLLNLCRESHVGVLLYDDTVFVAGGFCAVGADSGEIYTP